MVQVGALAALIMNLRRRYRGAHGGGNIFEAGARAASDVEGAPAQLATVISGDTGIDDVFDIDILAREPGAESMPAGAAVERIAQ